MTCNEKQGVAMKDSASLPGYAFMDILAYSFALIWRHLNWTLS
jgi:hypothetical protein